MRAEDLRPRRLLVRALRPGLHLVGRRDEQLRDVHVARVLRLRLQRLQDEKRHHHGARPVGHLVEVEREPRRQEHDLDRHGRHRAPRHFAVEREQRAGEDVGARRAAAREDRLARAAHVRRVDRVADHLQREIGLHAGAHVELAFVEERPAAVRSLDAAEIDARSCASSSRSSGSPRKCRKSTYSEGIVASASSSKHQWPSPLRSLSSASVARRRHAGRPRRDRRCGRLPGRCGLVECHYIDSSCGSPRRSVPAVGARHAIGCRETRADRSLDRRRKPGVRPIAGKEQVRVARLACRAGAPPPPASRRRSPGARARSASAAAAGQGR